MHVVIIGVLSFGGGLEGRSPPLMALHIYEVETNSRGAMDFACLGWNIAQAKKVILLSAS